MADISLNNRRIVNNTLILYVRLIITTLIALFSSRVVLQALGVSDYGVFSIVGGLVSLCSCVTTTMAASTQRFFSIELGHGSIEKLKKIFSMSMTTHIIIVALLVLIAETIGLWFLNNKMQIPEGREIAANVIYQFSVLSLSLNFITIPYSASVISHENMGVFAIIAIADAVLKLGFAYLVLIIKNADHLIVYGFFVMIISIVNFLAYRIICKNKYLETSYYFCFDRSLFKEIFGFSLWMMIGQIAIIVANQGINIVINLFYTVSVNAAMGIATQVNGIISSLATNVQTAVKPQLVKSYASGNFGYLTNLIFMSSKLSFYILFICALPIILNIEWILDIWLVEVPKYAGVFCALWIVDALFNALGSSSGTTVEATGKIKIYQIVISILFLSNLFIIYPLFKSGFPPYVALIVKVTISLFVVFVRALFASKYVYEYSFLTYITKVIVPVFFSVALCLVCTFAIDKYLCINRLISTPIVFIISLIFIYLVGLSKQERSSLMAYFKSILLLKLNKKQISNVNNQR